MPRTRIRIRKRKNKTKNQTKKCICKYNCKQCGKLYKSKNCYVKHKKKCVKKKCRTKKYCCVKLNISKRKNKKMKKIKKKLRKYGQRGCSQKGCRQRGGAMLNVGKNTFECDDAMNMGEIRSGSKYNDHGTHDLTSRSTQNDMVLQSGGGLGMLSEKFGLGQAATSLRNMQNSFVNGYRSWNGDHKVASADVTVAHENMKYN